MKNRIRKLLGFDVPLVEEEPENQEPDALYVLKFQDLPNNEDGWNMLMRVLDAMYYHDGVYMDETFYNELPQNLEKFVTLTEKQYK